MGAIKFPHASGNSVSIAAPAANPASDRTLYLPSNADGTIRTTTTPGAILQVVHASTSTNASQAFSAGTTFVDTNLSASITPTAASSKILVTGYVSFYVDSAANGSKEWNFAITDGSDNILDATTGVSEGYRINEMYQSGGKHPINFLHSPNTTSSFTYKIRMNAHDSNNTASLKAQNAGQANNTSRITLMEVAA